MNGKQRMWAIVLALALCANTAALAMPSKTIVDMVTVGEYSTSTGVVPKSEFIIYVTAETVPWMQDLDAFLALADIKKSPINFFSEEMKTASAALLPTDINLQSLQMNEFVPFSVLNYEEEYGDVTAGFIFPTPYSEDQKVVALAAIYNLDTASNLWSAEWFACPAKVENGHVYITFTSEYLEKLEGGFGSLAVLSL